MGTRADFYVGRGAEAEWIGSVAYDGHPENFKHLRKKTEAAFRKAVAKELGGRDDATLPAEGWPWPWNDSGTSDYAYAFDAGDVFHTAYTKTGKDAWAPLGRAKFDDDGHCTNGSGPVVHPDMSARKNVKMPGSKGSGMMAFFVR